MPGKKRVLIYSEYWSSRGGGEKYLLCIIETLLRADYDVTVVAQTASFEKDATSRYFHVNIDGATVRFVDGGVGALRCVAEQMSREFDICVYLTNYRFFNSRTRQTFAVLQIPYGKISLLSVIRKVLSKQPKEAAKDFYRFKLLRKLRESQDVLVYSRFVHDSLEGIHNIPSAILEPPIDDFAIPEGIHSGGDTSKGMVILSVGRIFRGLYNDKRYDVLIEAFKKLRKRLPHASWTYHIVGSCGSDAESQRYLEELHAAATGHPIYFHVNCSYEDLRRHYNQAEIFWHAAGYGVDEKCYPERTEHFGMSTVEAMSAGCIPVVVNKGGQKEIVSQNRLGYLWNTVDELIEYTESLINDPGQRSGMRHIARHRFRDFNHQHFSSKLISLFKQLDED